MQDQLPPVLIFAQSARFLAESATRSGYTVWVADCFCDTDTIAVAERYLKLPPLAELTTETLLESLNTLSRGEHCLFIYGSGIELFYPILKSLPANLQPVGNNAETIEQIKTPAKFFQLLSSLDLRYPQSQFECPTDNLEQWLFKPERGLGGGGINTLAQHSSSKQGYFQRFISGISGSVLFLADSQQALPLSFNRQNHADNSFYLQSIASPLALPEQCQRYLVDAIQKLTQQCNLLGLNSLDFILDANERIWLLEINPRPSASCELLPHSYPVLSAHVDACITKTLAKPPAHAISAELYYLYAPVQISIPERMSWPLQCHDIPKPASVIEPALPVCSLLFAGAAELEQRQHIIENLLQKLVADT